MMKATENKRLKMMRKISWFSFLAGAVVTIALLVAWMVLTGGGRGLSLGGEVAEHSTHDGSSDWLESEPASDASNGKISNREKAEVGSKGRDDRQRFQDLSRRISYLREDIENSDDPSKLLADLYREVQSLDSFGRRAIYGSIENELAEIAVDAQYGLAWVAEYYPKIAPAMREFSFDGSSSEEHFLDFLTLRMEQENFDVIAEINKVPNAETKEDLMIGLVPRLMMLKEYNYQEDLASVDPTVVDGIYGKMFELSARDGVYRNQALDAYLAGLGGGDLYESEVSGWFRDKSWFWKNSEELAGLVADAEAGARRDTVIRELVSTVGASDPEAARTWLPLVSDTALAEDLSRRLEADR